MSRWTKLFGLLAALLIILTAFVVSEIYVLRAFANHVLDKGLHTRITLTKAGAHKSTHRITIYTPFTGTYCGSTAIGRHALLTAAHCEFPNTKIFVDNFDTTAQIVESIFDGNDHSILLLKGITFSVYAEVDQNHQFESGDPIFMWGNPNQYADLFRQGYYVGHATGRWVDQQLRETLSFDVNVGTGDSGSGLFDSDNKVAAVLSITQDITNGKLMGAFPLQFTQRAIERARDF